MLRALVLVLLLVNAAFCAWTQGWLNNVVGVRPDAQHEPQRLQLQQHADQVQVVSPAAAASATHPPAAASAPSASAASEAASAASASDAGSDAASGEADGGAAGSTSPASVGAGQLGSAGQTPGKPPICVEAGPFLAGEWPAAEAEVKRVLPAGHWTTQAVAVPGLWLVYMGPYKDGDQLERKQAELRRIKGLNFEEVRTPSNLAQGLSLGRFNSEEDAKQALAQVSNRGVRTAQVVKVRSPMSVQILRVPAADEGQQVKLSALKLPPGKTFVACRG
jgi:biotin carboxyl carrier protein